MAYLGLSCLVLPDKKEDGSPDVQNGQYKISKNIQELNNEFQELLSIELDLDINPIEIPLDKIPIGVLNSYDYNKLTGIIEFTQTP